MVPGNLPKPMEKLGSEARRRVGLEAGGRGDLHGQAPVGPPHVVTEVFWAASQTMSRLTSSKKLWLAAVAPFARGCSSSCYLPTIPRWNRRALGYQLR